MSPAVASATGILWPSWNLLLFLLLLLLLLSSLSSASSAASASPTQLPLFVWASPTCHLSAGDLFGTRKGSEGSTASRRLAANWKRRSDWRDFRVSGWSGASGPNLAELALLSSSSGTLGASDSHRTHNSPATSCLIIRDAQLLSAAPAAEWAHQVSWGSDRLSLCSTMRS